MGLGLTGLRPALGGRKFTKLCASDEKWAEQAVGQEAGGPADVPGIREAD